MTDINDNKKVMPESLYYEKYDFMGRNALSLSKIKISKLKSTITNLGITNIVNIAKSDKSNIVKELRNYYAKMEQFALKISIKQFTRFQAHARGFLVQRRKRCVNNEDFCTLDSKYEIPSLYYFSYNDIDKFAYCFDIRSIVQLIKHEQINPYNRNNIPPIVIAKMHKRIDQLRWRGIIIEYDKPVLTPEQEFRNKMLLVFHKFDALDNYTNFEWFAKLDIKKLKDLYTIAEDIWAYRAALPMQKKMQIRMHGIAFHTDKYLIKTISENNKRYLQNILLNEFDKFVSDGVTRDDRKLGAMLMLTALVEVSPEAAAALPQFVQINLA
jgi:hypothetical protein